MDMVKILKPEKSSFSVFEDTQKLTTKLSIKNGTPLPIPASVGIGIEQINAPEGEEAKSFFGAKREIVRGSILTTQPIVFNVSIQLSGLKVGERYKVRGVMSAPVLGVLPFSKVQDLGIMRVRSQYEPPDPGTGGTGKEPVVDLEAESSLVIGGDSSGDSGEDGDENSAELTM